MPVPLMAALGISFGCAVHDMMVADANDAEARRVNYEAFREVEEAARAARDEQERTAKSLLKLSKRKNAVMGSSLPKFVAVFQKVAKIDFQHMDFGGQDFRVALPAELDEMRSLTNVAGMGLSDKQLLSTMLFNGMLKGTLGAISGTIRKESEINLHVAYMNSDIADVAASQNQTAKVAIAAIGAKAERYAGCLTKLNYFFVRSIEHIDALIAKNGLHAANYSYEDEEAIRACFNLAETLKILLEQPLFDKNGAVSQQAMCALETGNAHLKRLQTM